MRKLSPGEVNLLTQSSRLVRAPSRVYLLGTATAVLSKAPGQGCSSQPAVLMFLFFLFCFLSDQPFLGAVLFTHGVVRHRWGKETWGVQGPRGWRGQSVRWVHRSHSRNSAAPLSGHGAWPWWAQCPGLGRGVTGLRNS